MSTLTRFAAVAVTALAVMAPVAAANAAPARPSVTRHWTTIETLGKPAGKQEACKVLINHGTAWKIYNRLDDRRVKGTKLEATLTVTLHGKATKRTWDSGFVKAGHISNVGTVVLPRATGHGLVMTIHSTNSGNGGIVKIGSIGRC